MFNIDSLILNLATCKRGSDSFRLNAAAFSAAVTGVGPSVLEKALQSIDVRNCWDGVGSHTQLARLLQTKGTRATGDRARERLKELWRWRNNLAHGGDEEIALTREQLEEAIDFVNALGEAIAMVVKKSFDSHE
jgi:hypothetical protein